jgi:predicted GNAT family acetyltransferase
VGCGTLLLERKLIRGAGVAGHIEDVVVDASARGRGLGKLLLDALVARARQAGCYKARQAALGGQRRRACGVCSRICVAATDARSFHLHARSSWIAPRRTALSTPSAGSCARRSRWLAICDGGAMRLRRQWRGVRFTQAALHLGGSRRERARGQSSA